jgi:hypothetical protein
MKDKPIPSPILWLFKPDEFDARVEFQFTTPGGELLRSQTWVLHHGQLDPLTTYLLQARAQLATSQPDLREAGQNYYILTAKVFTLEGELHAAVIQGGDKKLLVQQLAKFPLSFAITVDHRHLNFQLHIARLKDL